MSTSDPTKPIKLFISHASEDKADFVEPLEAALGKAGFDLWYDKDALKLTDSLFQRISMGLAECDYGVVVLSQSFFRKKWTQAEVGGLFALETAERKIIIPIWKDVTEKEVKAFSPLLADRLGILASDGVDVIVEEIKRLVQAANRLVAVSGLNQAVNGLLALDDLMATTQRAKELEDSSEGAHLAKDAVAQMIKLLGDKVEEAAGSTQLLKLRIISLTQELLNFKGGYALEIVVQFTKQTGTSVKGAELGFRVYQGGSDDPLVNLKFQPQFRPAGLLTWRSIQDDKLFTSDALGKFLFDEIVSAFKSARERVEERNSR